MRISKTTLIALAVGVVASVLFAVSNASGVFFSNNTTLSVVTSTMNNTNKITNDVPDVWYTFDGQVTTSTGSSNIGSLGGVAERQGGVSTTEGVAGQAFKFDGAGDNDYLRAPLPTMNTTTILFWITPSTLSVPSAHRMVLSFGGSDGANATYISLQTDSAAQPFASLRLSGTQRTLGSGQNSVVGQRMHIAVKWDGDKIRIYTDGILRNTSASFAGSVLQGMNGSGFLYIGRYDGGGGLETAGMIDDVRIYSRALSEDEIWNIAHPETFINVP